MQSSIPHIYNPINYKQINKGNPETDSPNFRQEVSTSNAVFGISMDSNSSRSRNNVILDKRHIPLLIQPIRNYGHPTVYLAFWEGIIQQSLSRIHTIQLPPFLPSHCLFPFSGTVFPPGDLKSTNPSHNNAMPASSA